jgi:hypothetical protein
MLGFAWGIAATWWVGMSLGIFLALSSRMGRLPKRNWRSLAYPIFGMLTVTGLLAAFAGWQMYRVASVDIPQGIPLLDDVLFPRNMGIADNVIIGLYTDWATHLASYAGGIGGGIFLCAWTLWRRWRARAR